MVFLKALPDAFFLIINLQGPTTDTELMFPEATRLMSDTNSIRVVYGSCSAGTMLFHPLGSK